MPTGCTGPGASRPTTPAGKNFGSYSLAPAGSITVEYSESKDGYAWQRRDLNEIPVLRRDRASTAQASSSIRTGRPKNATRRSTTPGCWATSRLCGSQYQKVHPRNRHVSLGPDYIYCLFGLVSPDGLNWTAAPRAALDPQRRHGQHRVLRPVAAEVRAVHAVHAVRPADGRPGPSRTIFASFTPVEPIVVRAFSIRAPTTFTRMPAAVIRACRSTT